MQKQLKFKDGKFKIMVLGDIHERLIIETKEDELKQKEIDIQSPEYIEQLAREKLGMYLENERVYVDSNM